jgi:hypothetical protein
MPAVHLPGSAGRKASAGRWPVFLAAGLVLAIGIQKGSEIASRAVGSGGDVSCPVIRDNTPISSTLEPLESPQNGGPCKVQGPGALVESSVSISAGVEALAVADTFALGFTKANNKEAIVADMDPGSWRPRKSTKSSDNGTILRVVPDERGADFQPLVDGRKKDGDLLRDRMLVSGAFPFDMATRGGNLVWGHRGKADTKELWELPAGVTKGLSAVRSAPFGRDERIFVAKLENRLLLGRLRMNPEPEARGHLEAVESAAATLGTPTIAVSGDTVMIAYPEKFLPGDPWRIRLARWKPGVGCPVPSTFVPPRGGLGVHTMAPSLAALPQGGFLLAWTEGPVGNHQVRAQAIGLEGEPDGPALEISRASVNAGQSSVAVGPSGIAGVAYFEGINESYKLMAVPLRCDGTQR